MFAHVLRCFADIWIFVHSLQHDDMFGQFYRYIMIIMIANHPNLYHFIFIRLIEKKRARKKSAEQKIQYTSHLIKFNKIMKARKIFLIIA